MMIMSKHNKQHLISCPRCSFGWYKSGKTVKQKLTRVQLKKRLTTIMVIWKNWLFPSVILLF